MLKNKRNLYQYQGVATVNQTEQLFKKLFDIGAIKIDTRPGQGFKMRIHDSQPEAPLSPIYINLRTPQNPKPGPLTPELVDEIGQILWHTAHETELHFDAICGIPNAGEPLARAFNESSRSDGYGFPHLTLRKETRNGVPVFVDIEDTGGLEPVNLEESRQNVVLPIDDVITYGGTKDGAIIPFLREGYEVHNVLVFCDREQEGTAHLKSQGIDVVSAFTATHIVETLYTIGAIGSGERIAVLSYIKQTRTRT